MAVVTDLGERVVVVSERTGQVHVKSHVKQNLVVQTTAVEIVELGDAEDPGDLTLIFDNGLV